MRVNIPPLPNTPSWRGVQLNTGTTLPISYLYLKTQSICRKNGTGRRWWRRGRNFEGYCSV